MLFNLVSALRRRIRLARYNDFNIAEYFRAQGAKVGSDCRIMVRSFGSEPFLISIGNHTTIAPGVAMVTHDGAAWLFTPEQPALQRFGKITIGDNCFIGLAAILMPGVTVGSNCIVGAGSVVTKDVPSNTVVAGCPAKPVCSVEQYRAKVEATWAAQCPEGYLSDLQPGTYYSPAFIQQRKSESFETLRKHLERLA